MISPGDGGARVQAAWRTWRRVVHLRVRAVQSQAHGPQEGRHEVSNPNPRPGGLQTAQRVFSVDVSPAVHFLSVCPSRPSRRLSQTVYLPGSLRPSICLPVIPSLPVALSYGLSLSPCLSVRITWRQVGQHGRR